MESGMYQIAHPCRHPSSPISNPHQHMLFLQVHFTCQTVSWCYMFCRNFFFFTQIWHALIKYLSAVSWAIFLSLRLVRLGIRWHFCSHDRWQIKTVLNWTFELLWQTFTGFVACLFIRLLSQYCCDNNLTNGQATKSCEIYWLVQGCLCGNC